MKEKDFTFNLRYRDKKNIKLKHIKINFLSLYVLDQLNELQAGIIDVQAKFDQLSNIQDFLDNKKVSREKKKVLKQEKKIIQNAIIEYGKNGYLDKRFDAIKTILTDNGYGDDFDLMNPDFWYKQVDRKEIKRFLQYCLVYSIEGAK
jgi:hypothetical protein